MLSTRDVLDLLRNANPGVDITEDRVRHAMRRDPGLAPKAFAGRLMWQPADAARLAEALALAWPAVDAALPTNSENSDAGPSTATPGEAHGS